MKGLYRGSALQLALFPLVETEAHRLRADGFQSEDGPLTAPPLDRIGRSEAARVLS